MKIEIKIVSLIEDGCFGVLKIDEVPILVTLWRTYSPEENPKEVVKINPGVYRCTPTTYYKHGYKTFEIHVPEHERILFHILNVETESDGCVGIGEKFGRLNGKAAILSSQNGFNKFMSIVGHLDSFDLIVTQ